ncbi:phage shock protein B [Beggiatoa alba B18LD]|uniref:Phage shock protein B n=1 Tax=Beggiatoa alba B18LD TaxID=395493 RepID=I3CJI1_9GAMM|nr:envelope stress response membrane protein PspB [Beggiatoa alba]EIJ43774.1 phage shock protein B [Beggiatoa alba B18LD]
MKEFSDLLAVLIVFILPLWLILHYRWKSKQKGTLSEEDQQRVLALQKKAEVLENRILVLESILDNALPEWRKQK